MSNPLHFSPTSKHATSQTLHIALFGLKDHSFRHHLKDTSKLSFRFFSIDDLPVQSHFDIFFFELTSDNLEVLQRLCQTFEHVPGVAILAENLDPSQVLALGVHDYLYPDELRVSALQRLTQKILARQFVNTHAQTLKSSVKAIDIQQETKIIEHSPAMVYRWYMPDISTIKFIFVSQNIKQLGYSSEDFLNGTISWLKVIHPEDFRDTLKKYIRYIKEGVSTFSISYRIFTREGALRWIEDHSSIERHPDGRVKHFQGLILDITERKEAELKLKEREDVLVQHNHSLQLILDSIDFGVLIVDAHLKLRLANHKFRQLFLFEDAFIAQGPHVTEMLEKNRYGKLYAIEPDKWPDYVQHRLNEVTQGNVQNAQIARADDTVLKYNIQILPDGGRMLTYYDITDLRKAEEKARQEQRLLRAIIDATPDWIFVKDKDHRFILSNRSLASDLGLELEELVGKTDLELGFPEALVLGNPEEGTRGYWADDDEVIQSGQPRLVDSEISIVRGKLRYLNTAKIPLEIEGSESRALLGFVHNITALKEVESALQQKTAYLEALHETALGLMNRLELSELLDKLAIRIKELSGAEDSFIYFVNEQEHVLELVHSAGRFPKMTVNPRIAYGQGVAGMVWKTGQPLVITNYRDWVNRMQTPQISNMQVVAAFPITSADKVIGILGIASDKTIDLLHKDLMELLPGFAQLASVAIDNARLHDRTKADLLRTRALYKVGQTIHSADSVEALLNQIVDSALEALSARWVILYKLDVDNQRVEQVAMTAREAAPLVPLNFEQLQQGLTGWALKHQQPILSLKDVQDAREHPQVQCLKQEREIGSVLIVPLIYQGKSLGSLAALNRIDDPDFNEADKDLLQAISQQATLALAQHELNLQIQHQAFHDAVTDLPNRRLFEDRLELALAQAERYKTTLAILFIDLDGFKHVNDTLGHHAGDLLLIEVANRLKLRTRESDTLARMGGDEFALILNNLRYPEDAIRVAQSYLELFQKSFMVNHQKLFVGASVGVSVYPEDGRDPGSLLKHADSAMYQAKAEGKNNVRCFTRELADQAKVRLELENALRHALENRELELYYQPQINLQSGICIGVEALLRWKNPKHGLISPAKFIPLAEESGLMLPIGEWVLQEACKQNMIWQQAGYKKLRMSVNISALQFERRNFVDSVIHALEMSGLEPASLELEVTESVVMKNIEVVIMRLKELKRLGLSISIDDFGIGYSSLQYLQRLPLNSLKIDRSFIQMIGSDNPSLLMTILQLGRNFNLRTVAEGVETQAQLDFLLTTSCDEVQGFYFAKPLPASEFEQRWLRPHMMHK